MTEKKSKAAIYLKIIWRTMKYIGHRHPYMTAGLTVRCIGCLGIAITKSFSLGILLIAGVIGAIAIIRWMFITSEDFGSVRKKTQRKLRKKEALERYLKFLEQGL